MSDSKTGELYRVTTTHTFYLPETSSEVYRFFLGYARAAGIISHELMGAVPGGSERDAMNVAVIKAMQASYQALGKDSIAAPYLFTTEPDSWVGPVK